MSKSNNSYRKNLIRDRYESGEFVNTEKFKRNRQKKHDKNLDRAMKTKDALYLEDIEDDYGDE